MVAAILDFKMAASVAKAQTCFSVGSVAHRKVILVALPRFLGMTYRMEVLLMTSHGRHIEFQDGRRLSA